MKMRAFSAATVALLYLVPITTSYRPRLMPHPVVRGPLLPSTLTSSNSPSSTTTLEQPKGLLFVELGAAHDDPSSAEAARDIPLPFILLTSLCATLLCLVPTSALAAGGVAGDLTLLNGIDSSNLFDPTKFQPVCPGSDGLYQVLKYTANSLVGAENVVEYGPLIASVLLRVRLELCVLESFLYEAVVPFIRIKGVSWVLPLHETVETVLAGTIFAVASNFILLGSTKILSVLFIYADALTGMPTRFIGGQAKKRLPGVGKAVGTGVKAYGDALGAVRGFLEGVDTFVGRYLVVGTTVYIAFKFAHYKLFNDFFP